MLSFPSTGGYLSAIRQSSRNLRQAAGITISPQPLLLSPAFQHSFKNSNSGRGLALPLRFSSHLEELNLISVLALLNFGSGYCIPLRAQTGRGAWDSIRALVFSLYITSSDRGDFLSAQGMKAVNDSEIAELLAIPLHVERPHDTIPGVTIGELGGPLYGFVQLIVKVLNETGTILARSGYPNLGAFVAETLKESSRGPTQPNANVDFVMERLIRTFPAFQDMSKVDGQEIYCFKKALFLMHVISVRFGSMCPPPFPIPSSTQIPVFADIVLPSLLIHLGVIDISSSQSLATLFPGVGSEDNLKILLGPASSANNDTTPTICQEGPVLNLNQAYTLRAAAIDACELLVDAAHLLHDRGKDLPTWLKEITLSQLNMWLWAVAEDRPEYRALGWFTVQGTSFF